MAMIKTNGSETEGKVGGDIYRSDQCRQHLQADPRDIEREPSTKQKARRRAFQTLINYIKKHATQIWTVLWQIYANRHPRTTKKGVVYYMTWWQAFISVNINRVIDGLPILDQPPND